jgi:hypothetical protein
MAKEGQCDLKAITSPPFWPGYRTFGQERLRGTDQECAALQREPARTQSCHRYCRLRALAHAPLDSLNGLGPYLTNGDAIYLPDLLRVKGNLLLAKPQACVDQAETYFSQSLELSRQQDARLWELRTATDLAKLMAAQGQREDARTLLEPVFTWFVEGLDTDDLKAVERLLTTLR